MFVRSPPLPHRGQKDTTMDRVKISYFTDMLCVWAYVSQVRMSELKANFK